MSFVEEEEECEFNKENFFYSFPAFNLFDDSNRNSDEKRPPLLLKLIPLPYTSEDFEQMPVGARGWYASAILSAMMITSFSNIGRVDVKAQYGNFKNDFVHVDCLNSNRSEVFMGRDLLSEDLRRACTGVNDVLPNRTGKSTVFLELGSGAIGLSGMAMAWIVAQYQFNFRRNQDSMNSRNKILLTDYDHNCLLQLERNVAGVRQTFRKYFSETVMKDQELGNNGNNGQGVIPDIDVAHLDWNEFDKDQSPVLSDATSNEDINHNLITFVCGAALVYTEDTAACVDQVAKILRLNPKCVVWIVQWPRDGWFNVFQQDLLSTRFKDDGLQIEVRKFGPSSSPDLFSVEVQQLAQKLMPVSMQPEPQINIKEFRAVRITNKL